MLARRKKKRKKKEHDRVSTIGHDPRPSRNSILILDLATLLPNFDRGRVRSSTIPLFFFLLLIFLFLLLPFPSFFFSHPDQPGRDPLDISIGEGGEERVDTVGLVPRARTFDPAWRRVACTGHPPPDSPVGRGCSSLGAGCGGGG